MLSRLADALLGMVPRLFVRRCVGDLLQMNLIQLATQPASAVVLENLFTALKLVCC
jgi:hypothetical protein